MTPLSEREQHQQDFLAHLARERAAGTPPDTSWTTDLPDDPLPEAEDETSVVFVKKGSQD